MKVRKHSVCSACDGTGAETGGLSECDECNGSGTVKVTRRTPFGVFATQGSCKHCNGTGEVIEDPCAHCKGEGRVQETKELEVKIPQGMEDGMRLRLAGEGEAGERNAPTGDLYVTIHVLPHKIFTRDGNDLRITIPISFATAALGGEITVPTFDGDETLKIPHATQPNTEFRIKSRGIPQVRGYGTGSILVTVTIEVPDKLTKRQVELLKEFDGSKKRGFFS
ncbi:MAG: DnaJ C-terminal domain-containing protein, partial [Nanoarchaeota archaeon]